jgi:predicted transcriptional regulator
MNGQVIFIENIIPKEILISGKKVKIETEKSKGKIKVFYKAIKGKGPKKFIFPESILVNGKLGEFIGLYVGDGKTTKNEIRHAEFVSKDKELNFLVLSFFKNLGVRNEDFTFKINYSFGEEEKIKREWIDALRISPEKVRIKKSYRYRFSTLRIQVNGTIFRLILDSLIKEVIDQVKQNAGLRRGFLRGVFAAEGTIAIRDNYINYISISYNPSTEMKQRDLYRDLFCIEDIKVVIKERKGNRGDIVISNWNNYLKLWQLGIFDICERKKERFLEMLKKVKICFVIKKRFLSDIFESLSMSQKETAELLGTYQASISRMINGDFLLQLEQIYEISKILKKHEFFSEIIKNIKNVRFGPNTYIESFSNDFVNMLFELRTKNYGRNSPF